MLALFLCAHAVSLSNEEIGVPAFMVAWFRGGTDLSQEMLSVRSFRDLAELAINPSSSANGPTVGSDSALFRGLARALLARLAVAAGRP